MKLFHRIFSTHSKNEGIDTETMESPSFQNDCQYNHHCIAKYSGGLYDDTVMV